MKMSALSETEIEQIQNRMVRIRNRANIKASRLGEETRKLLDWRQYVRRFPWVTVASAAALGYLVIPRKSKTTAQAVAALLQQQGVNPAHLNGSVHKPGLVKSAAKIALNLAVRAGMAYASKYALQMLATPQVPPQHESDPVEEHAHEYA